MIMCVVTIVQGLAAFGMMCSPVAALITPNPIASACTWFAVIVLWCVTIRVLEERPPDKVGVTPGRGVSVIEVVPYLLWLQHFGDRWVTYMGTAVVLFGNVAAMTELLRDSDFPVARVRRNARFRR